MATLGAATKLCDETENEERPTATLGMAGKPCNEFANGEEPVETNAAAVLSLDTTVIPVEPTDAVDDDGTETASDELAELPIEETGVIVRLGDVDAVAVTPTIEIAT